MRFLGSRGSEYSIRKCFIMSRRKITSNRESIMTIIGPFGPPKQVKNAANTVETTEEMITKSVKISTGFESILKISLFSSVLLSGP